MLADKKLNLIYRSSDVLVCPSLFDFGPHIVTEALLNDLPVVAFNQGIAHDTVLQGKNGYLVNSFDIKKFSDSIYKILFEKKRKFKIPSVKKIKKFAVLNMKLTKLLKYLKKT